MNAATENDKSNETLQLLREKMIFIPERYYNQMAKDELLELFVNLIEQESIVFERTNVILHKHNIKIPSQFIPRLIQSGIFERFLNIMHDVNREKDISETKFFKENVYQCRKRSYDSIDKTTSDE